MKNILLALILITTFACKNEVKKEKPLTVKKELKVIKAITTPKHIHWINKRNELLLTGNLYKDEKEYSLKRVNTSESAYTIIDNLTVDYGSDYRVSINVKKGEVGDLFGLRIQGKYPSRVDAIFDLKKGVVVGKYNGADFTNAKAEIYEIGEGWYRCTLSGEVNADKVWIVLGSTMAGKGIGGWESKTKEKSEVYIIPTSLKFEEIKL